MGTLDGVALPVLGSGGAQPGITGPEGNESIVDLPPGSSVHAVAVSPNGTQAIAGSKSGELLLLDLSGEACTPLIRKTKHASPIVAVCWWDDFTYFFSDVAGRFLRATTDHARPVPFRTSTNDPVCALARAGDCMAALVVSGAVLLWQGGKDSPPVVVSCQPPPPQPFAWASLLYWEPSRALVFPARGGGLTRLDLKNRRKSTIQAHAGTFYAVQDLGDQLLTIGSTDGCARFWTPKPFGIERTVSAPSGIVAFALSPNTDSPIIAVGQDGGIQTLSLTEDGLSPVGVPVAGAYRCIAGITGREHVKLRAEHTARCVQQHVKGARERLHARDFPACEAHAEELERLGRRDLALVVRAELAEAQGDASGELAHRLTLSGLLPDSEDALPSLTRHANLLAHHYLYADARDPCQRLAAIRVNRETDELAQRCNRLAGIVDRGVCVGAPSDYRDAPRILETWNVVDAYPPMRLLLRQFDELACCGQHIVVQDFVRECRKSPPGTEEGTFPVCHERLHQLDRWEERGEFDYAIFSCLSPECLGLELGVRLWIEEGQTIAQPAVLFNFNAQPMSSSKTQARQEASLRLDSIVETGLGEHWIQMAAEHAEAALAIKVGAAKAQRRRQQS